MTSGRLGLLADLRGDRAALDRALAVLREEGCDRVACLGSTIEGGPDDAAILRELETAGATIVPSPHDAAPVAGYPKEAEVAGIRLAHAVPEEIPLLETSWLSGCPAPHLLEAGTWLARTGEQRACGDQYAPVLYLGTTPPRRRTFTWSEVVVVPDGPFLACPGSAAVGGRMGASVMTWSPATRELGVVRFHADGRRVDRRPVVVLVYCTDFDAHRPDPETLAGVRLIEKPDADRIAHDVAELSPDLVLIDYHLAGRSSGLDAVIALQHAPVRPPAFTIAGNPADNEGMKSAGALGGLPFTFLKDVLSRLLLEITGGSGT